MAIRKHGTHGSLLECAVDVYHIEPEPVSVKKRIERALLALAIFIAANFVFHHLWSSRHGLSAEEYIVDGVIAMATDFFSAKRKPYDVEIDDEEIRLHGGDWLNERVRRGRIRLVRELSGWPWGQPSLMISEHGPIVSRLLGCVSIPRTASEYPQIKAKALNWMNIG